MPGASEASRVLDLVGEAVRSQQQSSELKAEPKCILFLGAGVHAPPPEGSPFRYPPEQRPPIGAALSRELARECDFAARFPGEDPGNLQRVALAYEIDSSRARLVDAITSAVDTGKAPSPMLQRARAAGLPARHHDELRPAVRAGAARRGQAAARGGLQARRSSRRRTFATRRRQSPVIYKLHGDIAQRESLVITDEDYIQFVLRMSDKEPYDPIPLSLKYFLTRWTTLFVGYSLLDYNLRLLFKTLRWKIDPASVPDMYSVDVRPDPLILDVWQSQRRYVKFIAQDVWSFVPRLYELVRGEELAP